MLALLPMIYTDYSTGMHKMFLLSVNISASKYFPFKFIKKLFLPLIKHDILIIIMTGGEVLSKKKLCIAALMLALALFSACEEKNPNLPDNAATAVSPPVQEQSESKPVGDTAKKCRNSGTTCRKSCRRPANHQGKRLRRWFPDRNRNSGHEPHQPGAPVFGTH